MAYRISPVPPPGLETRNQATITPTETPPGFLKAWLKIEERHRFPAAPAWLTEEYYDGYDTEGLKAWICARFGPLPLSVYTREDLIDLLMNADTNDGKRWTGPFRFMDLPAELRILICSELLVIPKARDARLTTKRGCHPAILRVSKQIAREATGVLYSECPRELSIVCGETSRPPSEAPRYGINNIGECTILNGIQVPAWRDLWLEMDTELLRFEKLAITLELEAGGPPFWAQYHGLIPGHQGHALECCAAAARFLTVLAVRMATSTALQSVELHVVITRTYETTLPNMTIDDAMLEKVLWPMTIFGAGRTVKVTGVSAAVQRLVQRPAATM
jgi:hypothetical protein